MERLIKPPYYLPGKHLNWKNSLSSFTLEDHSTISAKIAAEEKIGTTKELTLSKNLLTSPELLEYTGLIQKCLVSLISLDLSENLLDDEAFAELYKIIEKADKFVKLQILNVSHNRITSKSKEAIFLLLSSDKKTITRFDISGNCIKDDTVVHVFSKIAKPIKHPLRYFGMAECGITDIGIDAIMKGLHYLPKSIEVDIARNLVTKEKLAELYEVVCNYKFPVIEVNEKDKLVNVVESCKDRTFVLKAFQTLMELPLHTSKSICLDGRHISQAFSSLKIPETVDPLPHGYFQSCFINDFLEICTAYNSKSSSESFAIWYDIMRDWEKREATHLTFASNRLLSTNMSALCELLLGFPQLEHLDLSRNCIGSHGFLVLAKHFARSPKPKIKRLDLSCCELSPDDGSLEAFQLTLTSLKWLEELDISHNNVNDEIIGKVKENIVWSQKLTRLNLSYNSITEKSAANLRYIVDMKDNWEELNLTGNACRNISNY